MSVLKKRRFADGKGRRYTDKSEVLLQSYGFVTLTTSNSAPEGTARATRISPLSRRRLYALRRPPTVDVSMLWSQFDPSTGRKMGSVPRVRSKRSLSSGGEMLQPWAAR